jgi:hypothetical protein
MGDMVDVGWGLWRASVCVAYNRGPANFVICIYKLEDRKTD